MYYNDRYGITLQQKCVLSLRWLMKLYLRLKLFLKAIKKQNAVDLFYSVLAAKENTCKCSAFGKDKLKLSCKHAFDHRIKKQKMYSTVVTLFFYRFLTKFRIITRRREEMNACDDHIKTTLIDFCPIRKLTIF